MAAQYKFSWLDETTSTNDAYNIQSYNTDSTSGGILFPDGSYLTDHDKPAADALKSASKPIEKDEPKRCYIRCAPDAYAIGKVYRYYPYQVEEYNNQHMGPNLLIMDGEWHSVDRYPDLIKRLDIRIAKGQHYPWYVRRGDGFQLLDPDALEGE